MGSELATPHQGSHALTDENVKSQKVLASSNKALYA